MTVVDLLRDHSVHLTTHGESPKVTEGWGGLTCPHCRGVDHLGVNLRSGGLYCWSCGQVDRLETLSILTGLETRQILRLLRRDGETDSGYPEPVPTRQRASYAIPEGVGPLLPPHRQYLRERGFHPDEIVRIWGVGGIGPLGVPLAWRLFIPIFGNDGRPLSWTTRAIGPRQRAKYISAPPHREAYHHKSLLYGEHLAGHACVVVEGPVDAWAVGPGAVALCGVGYTRAQVARLSRFPVRVVCLDQDDAGRRRAGQLAAELECHPGETAVVDLDAADPGSASKRELSRLRRAFGLRGY